MKFTQHINLMGKWNKPLPTDLNSKNTVCFTFYGPDVSTGIALDDLRKALPDAIIVGCSGAGEILGTDIKDNAIVATVVQFERSTVKAFCAPMATAKDSLKTGEALAKHFDPKGLRAVYILSEGLTVNGSELMKGIRSVLQKGVVISGGLAGDGTRFKTTTVLFGETVRTSQVVAIGFYGDSLIVGAHSKGGWLPFGPERKVTRSEGNVLHSLDGKPALSLYKEFLGENAAGLPSSALNFPLLLGAKNASDSRNAVRTILAVDESSQTMTFAGDIPEGEIVRFMRSTDESLVDAAKNCANACQKEIGSTEPALSLMVSCVGRRIVLGSSTEEEIETVFNLLPKGSLQAGFYSYGELAPGSSGFSDLHNQTVTLTWFQEKKAA